MAAQASFSSGALHGHDHTVSLLVQVDFESQGTCCHGTRKGVKPGSRGLQLGSVAEGGGLQLWAAIVWGSHITKYWHKRWKRFKGFPGQVQASHTGKCHRRRYQSVVPCTKTRDRKDMDIDCLQPWLWSWHQIGSTAPGELTVGLFMLY